MARLTFRSFTGGEVSASLAARYDLQKAGTFLQLCENMVVNAIGDIERRPGTLFMEDFGVSEAFLLPFQFNSEPSENYILVFQAEKISVRSVNDPQFAQDIIITDRAVDSNNSNPVFGQATYSGTITIDNPGLYCFCVCGAGGGGSDCSVIYHGNSVSIWSANCGEPGRAVICTFWVCANSSVSACIGQPGGHSSAYIYGGTGGAGYERGGDGIGGYTDKKAYGLSGGGGGGGSSSISVDGQFLIAPGGKGGDGYPGYYGGAGGSSSLGHIGVSANNVAASGGVSWCSLRLTGGQSSGGQSSTVLNPYPMSDVPGLSYAQVGDVLYLAHRNHPLRKITRSGEYPYTWTMEDVVLNQSLAAPIPTELVVGTRGYEYYTCNGQRYCCEYGLNETSCLGYKVSAVGEDGVESLASEECQLTFRYPSDWIVGDSVTFWWAWADTNGSGCTPEYFNVYRDSAGYYGFIGTTCRNVYCFVDENFEPDVSMTPKEDWDPFADGNYPGTVVFHQQRMWLGGTKNEPTTIYASRTGDFESFRKSRPLQDDDPLEYQMATGSIDDVMWLKSFGSLFVGTSGGEFTASSSGAALTPEDVQINLQSSWGSRGVMPLLVGNAILHVRRNGSRVIELAYNWENDSYAGNDLTLLAPHMVEDSPIRQWCFTQSPEPRIWAVREDGVLICCTYIREQNIYAWSRHITEGKFVSIISLCGDKEDEIVMLVKREVEGETHFLLERFAPRFDDNTAIEDAFFVDCGVIFENTQGKSELESSSLAHLAGKTVSVLNVGSPEMGHIVVNPDVGGSDLELGPSVPDLEPEPEPGPEEPGGPDDDDNSEGGDGDSDDGFDDDFSVETPEEPEEPEEDPDDDTGDGDTDGDGGDGDNDDGDDDSQGETTSYYNCCCECFEPTWNNSVLTPVLITVGKNSCVNICSSCFNCNRGYSDGGVAVMDSGSCLTIYGSVFCNNCSPSNGGVISAAVNNATFNICCSEFTANCAYCCAAASEEATPYADDDDDNFGTGGDSGGDINWTGQCAPAIGGVVYSAGSNTITINDSCFCQNEGSCGGAIGLITGRGSCLTICNSCFEENCGLDSGGGVYVRCTPDTQACIDCVSFTQNYAAWGGAGVAVECCAGAHISNSEFCCNCSKFYGGGLYVNNQSCAVVDNTCFCNDHSACGAIFVCCRSCVVLCNVCVGSDTSSLGLNVGANSCVTLCGCNIFCNSNICLSNASMLCAANGCLELWNGTVCCGSGSAVLGSNVYCCSEENNG